jgi:HAAS
MPDPLADYLAELERALRVHPRRRSRILAEIESHLQESAARHGAAEAITRLGPPSAVARSFSPGPADRLWAERGRLAALVMLAALLACVPLARDLWKTNAGDRGVILYAVFLAPAALVATASAILVLLRRPAGRRLVAPLVALVAVAALFTLLDLPPVAGVFDGYRSAVGSGYESSGCGTRALAVCAADHADELRLNYTAGAIALTVVYCWAVTGWTPGRRRRSTPARDFA